MQSTKEAKMKKVNNFALATITLEETVEAYLFLQEKIKKAEKELAEYKVLLEQAASDSEGNTLFVGDHRIKLVEATRENFNVKQARETLGNQILAPFTNLVTYTRLTVTKKAA